MAKLNTVVVGEILGAGQDWCLDGLCSSNGRRPQKCGDSAPWTYSLISASQSRYIQNTFIKPTTKPDIW